MYLYSTLVMTASKTPQGGQNVNAVGKYLYKHIDGAFNITFSPNMCDVYLMILYQIPQEYRRLGGHPEDQEMYEMIIDLNITTYQNKIRVNVIEDKPEERTLGSYTFKPEQMEDLNKARELIYNKVTSRISKVYEDYDFIF